MTLDQAIEHAEEKAKAEGPCAQDHQQLAAWLRELRTFKSLEGTLEGSTDGTEDRQGLMRWHAAASCIGYNELAKQATVLGEKVYFRLGRQMAERSFVALGGNPFMKHDPPILELPDHMPYVKFAAKDIELMREAVRAFDEASQNLVLGC